MIIMNEVATKGTTKLELLLNELAFIKHQSLT
jgi:hypothetical protein